MFKGADILIASTHIQTTRLCPAGQPDADTAAASKRVWLARKKVYFFTVFANEFCDDLSPLSKVVDIEYGMQ